MISLRWPAAVAALLLTMIAGGCGDGETGRTLSFKPGVFQGEKLPPLTAEQRSELTKRSNLMRF